MEITDAFDIFEAYDLLLFLAGLAFLAVATLPRFLHDKPFTLPIGLVAFGYVAFALPLGFDFPDPIEQGPATERLTELGVIISLMVAGLTIDRVPGLRSWSTTWRLLAVTMPLTVGGVALLGWGIAGLVPASALLLGAVIAPTDPVQGKDVEVGAPQEGSEDEETEEHDHTEAGEEDEVRFALTSEAGLNDGLAFPYTNMAIAMAIAGAQPGNWFGAWVTVDVGYKLGVALVMGVLVGRALGALLLRVPYESDLSRSMMGIGALAATLIVYGLTEYAGGYGFIATFVCAATIRGVERSHPLHRELQGFVESAERLLMAVIMVLFGGAIAGGLFAPLEWRHLAIALLVIFVVRPAAAGVALIGLDRSPWSDRAAVSFYGIRGIATFYYLAYALEQTEFPAKDELWATAGLIVLLSILIHGFTAAPVLERLDERREQRQESRRQDSRQRT
ncbi:MAG TPA: cation:proton antiporter [Egibacteraceae bacterium]|nr:cation:proton antiporter [Egibacteraceae bacterium]